MVESTANGFRVSVPKIRVNAGRPFLDYSATSFQKMVAPNPGSIPLNNPLVRFPLSYNAMNSLGKFSPASLVRGELTMRFVFMTSRGYVRN